MNIISEVELMALREKRFRIRDHYTHSYYALRDEINYDAYLFSDFSLREDLWLASARGQWLHGNSHTSTRAAPTLSHIDSLAARLENLINEAKAEELAQLLREDFIYEYKGTIEKENIHTKTPSEEQGHVYTYQICTVQPNMEVLILKHNDLFRRLLARAETVDLNKGNSKLHQAFVQQFKKLDLEHADLGELDLSEADFSYAKLKNARLTKSKLRAAVCIASDLAKSNISKEQLNSCKIYAKAKLAPGFWPYWTEPTKNKVLAGLQILREYGEKLRAQGYTKGEEALALADKLRADINHPSVKYNEAFQLQFLRNLHSKDNIFDKHRSYKRIIANLALCVLGGIVGYLIAALIHKKTRGHFTFFAKTNSYTMIENIEHIFKPEASPWSTFLLGTQQRVGEKSTIRKFFGQDKDKLNNALGDKKVFSLVKQFIY